MKSKLEIVDKLKDVFKNQSKLVNELSKIPTSNQSKENNQRDAELLEFKHSKHQELIKELIQILVNEYPHKHAIEFMQEYINQIEGNNYAEDQLKLIRINVLLWYLGAEYNFEV